MEFFHQSRAVPVRFLSKESQYPPSDVASLLAPNQTVEVDRVECGAQGRRKPCFVLLSRAGRVQYYRAVEDPF